jgi:hypothetical protein
LTTNNFIFNYEILIIKVSQHFSLSYSDFTVAFDLPRTSHCGCSNPTIAIIPQAGETATDCFQLTETVSDTPMFKSLQVL